MRIELNAVPIGGLVLDFQNHQPMPDGYGEGILDIRFDGRIAPGESRQYKLLGDLTISCQLPCDNCLKPVNCHVSGRIAEVFSNEIGGEDDDFWPVGENAIDIAPAINANIIALFPMKTLCDENCKGLCPICGKDLNEGACGCEGPRDPRFDVLSSFFKDEEV